MPRTPAVNQGAVLPTAPDRYDFNNERETRRLIEEALRRLLDYNTISNVPGNLSSLAGLDGSAGNGLPYLSGTSTMTLTALTAFGRALIAAVDAAAGRAVMGWGSIAQRVTKSVTTGSLANLAEAQGDFVLDNPSAVLVSITSDHKARVRLYGTSGARAADATRIAATRPTAGQGLLAEFVFDTAGGQLVPLSPIAILSNEDTVKADKVYYAIQNLSGSPAAVHIDAVIVPMELP